MRIRDERQQLNGSLMSSTSMNRAIGLSMVFLACLPLSAGCSSERSTSGLLETTTARAQADALVHDTQAELAIIRRDLAAARIATSKQEGEAAELRRKATALEADRAELRKMLEQAHSDVNALQNERDELKQTLVQTQTVSVVRQDSSAPTKLDETDLQADMKELNARMVLLTDELAQLKQRFANNVRATSVRTGRESSEKTAGLLVSVWPETNPRHHGSSRVRCSWPQQNRRPVQTTHRTSLSNRVSFESAPATLSGSWPTNMPQP